MTNEFKETQAPVQDVVEKVTPVADAVAPATEVELPTEVAPAAETAPAPTRRRRIASLDKRKARSGWLFVLPFLLGLILVYLPIVFNSLRFTLGELEVLRGGTYRFTFQGFETYRKALLVDPKFTQILVTGMKELIIDVPAIVIFSLFMAVLLNQKMFGRAAFRAIFFIPVIVSTGIVGEMDAANALMNSMIAGSSIDTGAGTNAAAQIVNMTDFSLLFENMAVGSELAVYVVDLVNDIYGIINRSGVQMLIFLAGLQSISGAIYESCSIDGASAWESFWKITLPMVSPMILVNAVYTVIDSFTSSSNSVMTYITEVYSTTGGDILSSAMAWIYFTVVILIILLVVAVLRLFVFYQRKD